MDYDENYVGSMYDPEDLNLVFINDFIRFRKENNLTQELLAKFSGVNREKIARIECNFSSPTILSLLKILAPVGYTIKIVKVKDKNKKYL